jgi:hypothetical protein
MSFSSADKALCELFIGAFFFAMRSCKHVQVSGKRKTKLLTLKNIRFFKGRRLIHFEDPLLHYADCVSITFEQQKRDTKNDVITQHRSDDPILCPLKIWANIIRWINKYPLSYSFMKTRFRTPYSPSRRFTHVAQYRHLRRQRPS